MTVVVWICLMDYAYGFIYSYPIMLGIFIKKGVYIGYHVDNCGYFKDASLLSRWYVYVVHMSME